MIGINLQRCSCWHPVINRTDERLRADLCIRAFRKIDNQQRFVILTPMGIFAIFYKV